jgi:putative tricarboxylic transport membrane protein
MLPKFTIFGPGPEFMPNVLAVVLIVSSTILFVNTLRKATEAGESLMPTRAAIYRIAVIIGGLFLYTFLIDKLGYLETTFAYSLGMLLAMWKKSWYFSLAVSLALTLGFGWAFGVLLDVPVPEGILEGILGI